MPIEVRSGLRDFRDLKGFAAVILDPLKAPGKEFK
jgi:hypothetical protein